MTRAITQSLFDVNGVFWDFVYQAAVIGLGVAATLAVYLQISGL
jgi:hypothetical protein